MVRSRQRIAFSFGAALLAFGSAGCLPEPDAVTVQKPVVEAQEEVTDEALIARIDAVLDFTYRERILDVKDQAAWQIMHGVLAYGEKFPLRDGDRIVGTVDYLADGGVMKGWDVVPGKVFDGPSEIRGVSTLLDLGSKAGQGHADQWVGYMAHAGIPLDQTFRIGDQTFSMRGFLEQAKWEAPRNTQLEYSWTLMALSQYESTAATWTAIDGETWSVDRLLEIEAEYALGDGPCGGCHRLVGLALICEKRRREGLPIEGPWATAIARLDAGVEGAKAYQNADGTFSTNYLARGGTTSDLAQILGTSGHVFEVLAIHLPDERLREPWVQRGATRMAEVFEATRGFPLECGALYHAVHGLLLYRNRLAGSPYVPPSDVLAP